MQVQVNTRLTAEADVSELCLILNDIIAIGGTTAYERSLSESDFHEHFLTGANCVCCHSAYGADGLLGFQALSIRSDLPEHWLDIATFARAHPKTRGVGTALFSETKHYLVGKNYTHINASIRADNRSGLAYYAKLGFSDYAVREAVPLKDGTPVDRISKQYKL